MNKDAESTLIETIQKHLPRDLCIAIEDGFLAAAGRAYDQARSRHLGHRASVLGMARHHFQNEAFAQALDANGILHSALRGNDIVVGEIGPLLLARFNISSPTWSNAKRSARRLKLAESNLWLERLVQPELFEEARPEGGKRLAVFFVGVFSGSLQIQPEAPISIQLAVPDSSLTSRLFSEPLDKFAGRYAQPAVQEDVARPRLKKRAHQDKTGTDGETP